MSQMFLDKSLDSIIADKKASRRKPGPRRSGGGAHAAKAKLVGKTGTPAAAAVAAAAKRAAGAPAAANASTSHAFKIIVSNLPLDVDEKQVKELFSSTVGPTKSCHLQYNAAGKSTGIATVLFTKSGEAQKAFDTYNNRLIDGKRPMKIEIVFDPAKQPLVNRVAAAAKGGPAASTVAAAGGGAGVRRGTGRGGRRGGRGGGGGRDGGKRPPKTAEDLDADMADYSKEAAAAA